MRSAELMLREAIRLYEAGNNPGEEANLAKLLAADAQWAAAEACLQTHGGFGFAEEYDVERKFREARLYQVAPDLDQPDPELPCPACAGHAAVILAAKDAALGLGLSTHRGKRAFNLTIRYVSIFPSFRLGRQPVMLNLT
jgi:hypothetical protein